MPSGYTFSEERGTFHGADAQYDVARVVNVPTHEPGDDQQHLVQIQMDNTDPNSVVWAPVVVDAIGDINMPVEGDTVRVAYEKGGQPVVISNRYTAQDGQADPRLPKYGPGHRRIVGGPQDDEYEHDSRLELYPDGTVELQSAPERPLIIGGGTKQMFLDPTEDQEFEPNGDFFKVEFDQVNTRLLSQQFLDSNNIEDIDDVEQVPQWDNTTYEWIIPEVTSEWRDPDPRGELWTVDATVRFEAVDTETACEVGLFIREEGDGPSEGEFVSSQTAHASHDVPMGAVTVDFSYKERFPQQSRLSFHARSMPGGGVLSSDPLYYDSVYRPIDTDSYGSIEFWSGRDFTGNATRTEIKRA